MGRIVSRKGRWTIIYDGPKKWSPDKGALVRNQKSEAVTPNTRSAAKKLLTQREADIHAGRVAGGDDVPFVDLANRWLQTEVAVRSKEQTVSIYRHQLEKHILPAIGSMPVSQVQTFVAQEFAADRLSCGLSASNVRHMVGIIRTVMSRGSDWGFRCKPLGKVHLPKKRQIEVNPLTPDEVNRMLAAARPRWRALLAWSVWTGMRLGEIRAAKWDHLDLDAGRYYVCEQVRADAGNATTFDTPKTDTSIDMIGVAPKLCAVMRRWHHELEALRRTYRRRWTEQGLLFPSTSGGPLHTVTIRQSALQRALDDAGLRHVRFHDLRHTCASLILHQTGNVKVAQKQLRHASAQVTFDVYGHLLPDAIDDAMAKLDDILDVPETAVFEAGCVQAVSMAEVA